MNTVFTDAICRILCLRRRRTYHWPAIAITHCASVFRIVAGTLSAFHARTTTSLRFSLLTRNTGVLLSSFVFFFSSFFFHTNFDRNEHSCSFRAVPFSSRNTVGRTISLEFLSRTGEQFLSRAPFSAESILLLERCGAVTLTSVRDRFLEMMHSRVYSYLYSSSKSHQFSRHPSLHSSQRFDFFSRGERKGRTERNLDVFNRPRDITRRVRLEENWRKYRGEERWKGEGKRKKGKKGGSTVCVFRSIWCFFHDACTPDYPVTMSLAMQGRSVGPFTVRLSNFLLSTWRNPLQNRVYTPFTEFVHTPRTWQFHFHACSILLGV